MDLGYLLHGLVPSWNSVVILGAFFGYLSIAGSLVPGKLVPGVLLPDGSLLHYKCNGGEDSFVITRSPGWDTRLGAWMNCLDPMVIAEQVLELFSVTLYSACSWFGIQLNPQFLWIDLNYQDATLSQAMVLYQLFCTFYIMDYFVYEKYMTSTWDIIAERLGFMLVFGDLVWIPCTFSMQSWWLLQNNVEPKTIAAISNRFIFLIGYIAFRGANKQKHMFKKNPKAHIRGQPPKLVGGSS